MRYFVKEIVVDEAGRQTAASKARDDADAILTSLDYKPLEIHEDEEARAHQNALQKAGSHVSFYQEWKRLCAPLASGDVLVVQFPARSHSILLSRLFADLRRRGVVLVLVIHDLEILRAGRRAELSGREKWRLNKEEVEALRLSSRIIAHNDSMASRLIELGVPASSIVVLGLFDYLMHDFDAARMGARHIDASGPVVIAGNISRDKAGYAYDLPVGLHVNLYGPNYTGAAAQKSTPESAGQPVRYFGSFDPNDLPYRLEGSFGLVWDGPTASTCAGPYGEYLRINNPHKCSLYLASGLPVAIWRDAALADFVRENDCGLAVESLMELRQVLERLDGQRYEQMRRNAETIGRRLRGGYYLTNALENALTR